MPPKAHAINSAAKPASVNAKQRAKSERNKTREASTSRVTRSKTRASLSIQAQPFPEREEDQITSRIPTTGKAQSGVPERQASAVARRTNKRTKGKQTTQSSQPGLGKTTQVPKKNSRTAERKASVVRAVAVSPNQDIAAAADNLGSIQSWVRGVHTFDDFVTKEGTGSEAKSDTNLWFQSYGGAPPEATMTPTCASTAHTPSDAISKATSGRRPRNIDSRSSLFHVALLERNIITKAHTDPGRSDITRCILPDQETQLDDDEERKWAVDFAKCERSNEPVFQRTIMMNIINRHSLADSLDWICEAEWTCNRMPRKMKPGAVEVVMPKPDLAVAFKTSSLINDFQLIDLGPFRSHMCPENFKLDKEDRAFHFFSLEATDPKAASASDVAINQNFNTASQALHNIYLFMAKAGKEDLFYEKVRFYSVVATSAGFHLRVHRATKLSKGRILPNYPLGFHFDEICSMTGRYTKGKVVRIVENVLVNYGINILKPILEVAVETVLAKLEKEPQKSTSNRERQAEDAMESFGSQRAKVGDLDLNDGTGSLTSQLIGSQGTVGIDLPTNVSPEIHS